MKRFFTNQENKSSFEILTANELLKVRGGGDVKPATRPKDIFGLD